MSGLLFFLGLLNLGCVISMLRPRSMYDGHRFMLVIMFFTLFGSELAWFWLLLQLVLAILFVAAGVLDSGLGWFGLLLLLATWPFLAWQHKRSLQETGPIFEHALQKSLGDNYRDSIPEAVQRNFRTQISFDDYKNPLAFKRGSVEHIADIAYLPGGVRQRLDIYRPKSRPEEGCPVLLQIHGGAWSMGSKTHFALPLMSHLAENGWICVAANYRLSPSVAFPVHLEDCKAALCWIREQGREYGMNPDFVAVTGGSAGGHLAALMGLTANRPELQKLHPEVDTSVQACVPLYGEYDFLTAHAERPHYVEAEQHFIDNIMHVSKEDYLELWQLASPIMQVHENAPPFMVIHGEKDSMLPVEKARKFADELSNVSNSPVVFAEVLGAEHGYEMLRTVRTEYTVDAIHRFLEWARANPV